MRGGALPAALLCVVLGLALGYAPRRALVPAFAALAAAAGLTALAPVDPDHRELVFAGCWIGLIVTALLVHLPQGLPTGVAIAAAVNAGVWSSAVIAIEGQPVALATALPWALLAIPAGSIVAKGWGIAIKIMSSWLIAVALLSLFLPTANTPGYTRDHME